VFHEIDRFENHFDVVPVFFFQSRHHAVLPLPYAVRAFEIRVFDYGDFRSFASFRIGVLPEVEELFLAQLFVSRCGGFFGIRKRFRQRRFREIEFFGTRVFFVDFLSFFEFFR
jgi:hypothetical protein